MTEICNEVVRSGKVPEDWKSSSLAPVYKGKGDPMQCENYRAIKLLEHGMKNHGASAGETFKETNRYR